MPQATSTQRFALDAMQAMVQMRIDLAKAEADVAMRWEQVLGERIKNVVENDKRIKLEADIRSYWRARNEAQRRLRLLERRSENWRDALRHAALLALGESIEVSLVSHAWMGLQFLLNNAPFGGKSAALAIPADEDQRRGSNFYKPSKPSYLPPTPQAYFAGPLFNWARQMNVVPRVGSPAAELLSRLFESLNSAAMQEATALQEKINAQQSELTRIRESGWKASEVIS